MRHRPSRSVIAAAVAAAVLGAAIGCASGQTGSANSSSAGGAVTITFLSFLRNSDAVVKAFNSSHTDVQVQFQQAASPADNYTTLANAAKAGTSPDVASVEYPFLPDLVSRGLLKPLSSEGAVDVDKTYPDAVKSLVTFGGKTWSYPLDLSPWLLYYRADLFQANGIKVPTTWAEYRAAGEKIKKVEPDARIGAATNSDAGAIESLNWLAGARWFTIDGDSWKVTIDNSVTRTVAQMQQSLVDKDLVWTDDAESLAKKQADGKTWSVLAGSWNGAYLANNYKQLKDKWKVAPPPTFDGTPATGGNGGATFAVSAASTKQAAAEKFIAWMTTDPEGIKARVAGGQSSVLPADPAMIPYAKQAFDASFYGGQDIYQVAQDAAATIRSGWSWGPAQTVMDTAIADNLAKVKSGSLDYLAIFGPVQEAVVKDLTGRGISVKGP